MNLYKLEPPKILADRWYITKCGRMAKTDHGFMRRRDGTRVIRVTLWPATPLGHERCDYDDLGKPIYICKDVTGLPEQGLDLAYLIPDLLWYEPTGEYRTPVDTDEAWFLPTKSAPTNGTETMSWAHLPLSKRKDAAYLRRGFENWWGGRRVILKHKYDPKVAVAAGKHEGGRCKVQLAKDRPGSPPSWPSPSRGAMEALGITEKPPLGLLPVKIKTVKYGDLEKSGLVPKVVMEYLRSRMFDNGGLNVDDPVASVLLHVEPHESLRVEIRFLAAMSLEDRLKMLAALAKETNQCIVTARQGRKSDA